jgi:hypothetical protein
LKDEFIQARLGCILNGVLPQSVVGAATAQTALKKHQQRGKNWRPTTCRSHL